MDEKSKYCIIQIRTHLNLIPIRMVSLNFYVLHTLSSQTNRRTLYKIIDASKVNPKIQSLHSDESPSSLCKNHSKHFLPNSLPVSYYKKGGKELNKCCDSCEICLNIFVHGINQLAKGQALLCNSGPISPLLHPSSDFSN